jgi:hypothetical protein
MSAKKALKEMRLDIWRDPKAIVSDFDNQRA